MDELDEAAIENFVKGYCQSKGLELGKWNKNLDEHNKRMELVNFMIKREKEIVRKEEEVYKAIAKSKATKRDIAEFIETMDYTPTPLQYVFIMDAITKMGIEMYDKGIVPSTMSNDEFDIAYEEMLQKTFSRIREHLEDDEIKGNYLIQ